MNNVVVKTSRTGGSGAKRLAVIGVLTALAIVMHYFEGLLPPPIPGVPVKLGLANVFTLFALIRLGRKDAILLTLMRCTLAPIIGGSVTGVIYSVAGGLCAFFVMSSLLPMYEKDKASAITLSVAGAFLFNVGQLAVGAFINGAAMLMYFPLMSILSIPTGIFVALLTSLISERVPLTLTKI